MKGYNSNDFIPGTLEAYLPNAIIFSIIGALNSIAGLVVALIWGGVFGFFILVDYESRKESKAPLWPVLIQIGLYLPILILLLNFFFQWIPLQRN